MRLPFLHSARRGGGAVRPGRGRGVALGLTLAALWAPSNAAAATAPPDYSAWGELLAKYYHPARGMKYRELRQNDEATLERIRQQLAQVDPAQLSRQDQLAYWINLYNVSVVGLVVDNYPLDSIRDLSTDPVIRLNVFKKPHVRVKGGTMSLNDVENLKVREGFRDARIHFAINCAAESCPPIRTEPYVGARIDEQLDDQARLFLASPRGARLEGHGDELTVHLTKVMDWFGEDFEEWAGGRVAFLKRYLSTEKRQRLEAAKDVDLEFDDYSWKLNDASR
jgi:hypothetical protein